MDPTSPTKSDVSGLDVLQQLATSSSTEIDVAGQNNEWRLTLGTLKRLFEENAGIASSRALRTTLESSGLEDARAWVLKVRHYSFEDPDDELEEPGFRWYCHAKSLYSEGRYAELLEQKRRDATQAGTAGNDSDDEDVDESPRRERRRNRQEERRLGTYVATALEDIYSSEFGPDTENVFDVHSERPGGDLENVDVLGVDWRSNGVVDLVAVEVKLDFTAKLVQQARNYQRFAHRVWIAVPVPTDTAEASTWLRDADPLLFDHVIESGLGILACRRRPGSCYAVVPVHWPRRMHPDPVEKERFVERYRAHLERAGVVAPRGHSGYPSL